MDPQVQNEFIALRTYLQGEFSDIRNRIGDLEKKRAVDDAATKAAENVKRQRGRVVEGLILASLPVALTALAAVLSGAR